MRSRKLIKGSFLNTLNLIAQILSGFYVMPLMIHTFGDAMFGIWILVASFMGYAAILDLGLPSAVGRFISQAIGRGGQEGDREIKFITATAFYIFIFITFLAILFFLAVVACAPLFLKDVAQIQLFRSLLLILCINTLFVFPASIFEGMLAANLRHDVINSTKIVFTVLRLLFTVMLIKFHYGLVAIAFSTVGCNVVENLLRVVLSYRLDNRVSIAPRNFKGAMVTQLFGYSVYTFIGKIADMLRFQINSCVITVFSGVAQVTPFRVASRLIEYFMQLIGGVTGVFSPYFSQEEGRKNFEGITEKFLFITRIVTYISTFVGGILVLYGKDFIVRWMGPQYVGSYDILVILAIPVTFALIQSTVFPLLYGISKHKFVACINVGEGVLNLILSIIFVKQFGILGVALGTAIPLLITKLFIQPIYVTKTLNISLKNYVLTIGEPFIKSLVALLVPWLVICQYVRPDFINLLIFASIQSAIFLLFVFFFGFAKKEKDYLLGVIRSRKK